MAIQDPLMLEITDDRNHWGRVRITPWWNLEHRDLPYFYENFNDPVTVDRWRQLGYQQPHFAGEMYDMRCPQPIWIKPFQTLIKMQHFGWSVYRMAPGRILPGHSDSYKRFRETHNINDVQYIKRFIFFLEDWQSGHYLEVDKCPITEWSAGDGVYWYGAVEHIAANIGSSHRFTLQITGTEFK